MESTHTVPVTSSDTSPLTCASARKCAGSSTRIIVVASCQRLYLNRVHRRQIVHNRRPGVASIRRTVHLPACGAKIHAALIQRIDGHGIAQHVDETIALRQSFSELFPF